MIIKLSKLFDLLRNIIPIIGIIISIISIVLTISFVFQHYNTNDSSPNSISSIEYDKSTTTLGDPCLKVLYQKFGDVVICIFFTDPDTIWTQDEQIYFGGYFPNLPDALHQDYHIIFVINDQPTKGRFIIFSIAKDRVLWYITLNNSSKIDSYFPVGTKIAIKPFTIAYTIGSKYVNPFN